MLKTCCERAFPYISCSNFSNWVLGAFLEKLVVQGSECRGCGIPAVRGPSRTLYGLNSGIKCCECRGYGPLHSECRCYAPLDSVGNTGCRGCGIPAARGPSRTSPARTSPPRTPAITCVRTIYLDWTGFESQTSRSLEPFSRPRTPAPGTERNAVNGSKRRPQ